MEGSGWELFIHVHVAKSGKANRIHSQDFMGWHHQYSHGFTRLHKYKCLLMCHTQQGRRKVFLSVCGGGGGGVSI